mmetsp:Transcript_23508/g.53028  ORF Transcript_23508/g.53028 Transcript_23508/m.53028 type:complete len:146 (+) Transcript_23508:149-586(+)
MNRAYPASDLADLFGLPPTSKVRGRDCADGSHADGSLSGASLTRYEALSQVTHAGRLSSTLPSSGSLAGAVPGSSPVAASSRGSFEVSFEVSSPRSPGDHSGDQAGRASEGLEAGGGSNLEERSRTSRSTWGSDIGSEGDFHGNG